MNSRIASTLPALSILLLLGGCPIWGDGGGDPPTRTCDFGEPCPIGYSCLDGLCVYGEFDGGPGFDGGPLDGGPDFDGGPDVDGGPAVDGGPTDSGVDGGTVCRADGDCAAGFYCGGDRVCAPSGTCVADEDCATVMSGFVCDFRDTCVPLPEGACRSQADCQGTDACIEGFCRDEAEYCAVDTDCGMGRLCLNGACTSLCFGGDTEPCGSAEVCDGGFCRPAADECSATSECGGGEHCVNGRCLADCESVACEDGDDVCGDDAFCRADWTERPFCTVGGDECAVGSDCVEGVCRTPCPTGMDMECTMTDPDLAVCGGDNYCRTTVESMPECRLPADCGADQDCLNATCRAR